MEKKVLICENDAIRASALANELHEQGYEVEQLMVYPAHKHDISREV